MHRFRRITRLCLIFAFTISSANAQTFRLAGARANAELAQNNCNCFIPKGQPPRNEVWIDARTGNVDGSRRFRTDDEVRIIIYNVNPFLYAYELKATAAAVNEAALTAFLPFLGKPVTEALPAVTASDLLGVPFPLPDCPGLKEALEVLKQNTDNTQNQRTTLKNDLKTLKTKHETNKTNYETSRQKLLNPNADCQELCRDSAELLTIIGNAVKPDEVNGLQARGATLQDDARSLQSQIRNVRTRFAEAACQTTGVKKMLEDAEDISKTLLADGQNVVKDAQAITEDLKTFDQTKAKVEKVRQSPTPFQIEKRIGNFDSTHEVTVELKRKLVESKEDAQSIASVKLKFGAGPFFTLSGGMVFSILTKRTYDKVEGFERDRNGILIPGQTATKTIIDLKEESDTRISPLVMLSGRLVPFHGKFGSDGLHLSFGVTAKNDGQNTNIEFLVGPSVSFLERQLFLTAGGYAGKQQRLAGSLYRGQPIAADKTITIQNNYQWHFGAAITYKIK